MRRIIKFICILSLLMTIFGCNKQSVMKNEKTDDNQTESRPLPVQEVSDNDNSNEEFFFKTYTLGNSVSDELLKEIEFDGKLCLYDLTVNDNEKEAYEKLNKNFNSIVKEVSPENIIYYSEDGVFNKESDFTLKYYDGKFMSLEKKNLSQNEIQKICDQLNIGCNISKLKGKKEYYKFKAGKFRFRFLLYYGQYSYYVFDASKNP